MNTYLNALAEQLRTRAAESAARALHAAAPEEIFGTLSQRAADADADVAGAVADAGAGLCGTTLFHAVTVLLLVCYMTVMYRNPEILQSLREHIFSPSAADERHSGDNRSDPLRGFSWGVFLLGVLFFCTAVVRLADTVATVDVTAAVRMTAIPTAAALFAALAAYQYSVLTLTGAVTVSLPFTNALNRIKSLYFHLAAVVLTPVLLLWALMPAAEGRNAGIIMAAMSLCIVLAFLRETFLLFLSKKLSIYHWFLYLCTVEAFPVSLVCLVAAKV